jgi:hypothetical protein
VHDDRKVNDVIIATGNKLAQQPAFLELARAEIANQLKLAQANDTIDNDHYHDHFHVSTTSSTRQSLSTTNATINVVSSVASGIGSLVLALPNHMMYVCMYVYV